MTPTTSYAQHEHHDFAGATTAALGDAPLQAALVRLTSTLMAANRRSFAAQEGELPPRRQIQVDDD